MIFRPHYPGSGSFSLPLLPLASWKQNKAKWSQFFGLHPCVIGVFTSSQTTSPHQRFCVTLYLLFCFSWFHIAVISTDCSCLHMLMFLDWSEILCGHYGILLFGTSTIHSLRSIKQFPGGFFTHLQSYCHSPTPPFPSSFRVLKMLYFSHLKENECTDLRK